MSDSAPCGCSEASPCGFHGPQEEPASHPSEPREVTMKMRGRKVTQAEALASAQRLINSHFGNPDQARMSIPVRPDNDDVVVMDYILENPPAVPSQADGALLERYNTKMVGTCPHLNNENLSKWECAECVFAFIQSELSTLRKLVEKWRKHETDSPSGGIIYVGDHRGLAMEWCAEELTAALDRMGQ